MNATLNPFVTSEQFEKVRPGHRVQFSPRFAVGGPHGLRKAVTGVVRAIDSQGRAQVGDWIIPVAKVRRYGAGAYKEWARAEQKAHRQHVYGALQPAEKRALESCAKTARAAFVSTSKYSGPTDKNFNAEMKRAREKFMREHGITDDTDRGQCEALAAFIQRAMDQGVTPKLEGIEYVSADSGNIGIGDVVSLGGKPFKLVGYTPDGKMRMKDGYEITVPAEYIPRDVAVPVKSVFKKLEKKRDERVAKLRAKPKPAIAVRPTKLPAPPPKVKLRRPLKRRRVWRRAARLSRPRVHASRVAATFWLDRPKDDRDETPLCRDGGGRFSSCDVDDIDVPSSRGFRRIKRRRVHRRRQRRWCFGRDKRGRYLPIHRHERNPKAKIITETDLLGREIARLIGETGTGEQIPLFDREHELTPDEKAERRETEKWRKRCERDSAKGQLDLFLNPNGDDDTDAALLGWLAGVGVFLYLMAKDRQSDFGEPK